MEIILILVLVAITAKVFYKLGKDRGEDNVIDLMVELSEKKVG